MQGQAEFLRLFLKNRLRPTSGLHSKNLRRANRQEPMMPALSFNFERRILVSFCTMLKAYLRMPILTGCSKLSSVSDSMPPMTISSGLKMLMTPASASPNLLPSASKASMHSMSSPFMAWIMSMSPMSPFSRYTFDRADDSPFSMRAMMLRRNARPDTSVSRHPFLPQWQSCSLSKKCMCPNSPANPEQPP